MEDRLHAAQDVPHGRVARIAKFLALHHTGMRDDEVLQRTLYPDTCPRCAGIDLLGRPARGTMVVPDDRSRVWCTWCGRTSLAARLAGEVG